MKCGMVNENTALRHHFFEITQAELIGQIPAYALSDNLNRIMQSLEGVSDQRRCQATSQKKQYVT
jgi:hypothetical protein